MTKYRKDWILFNSAELMKNLLSTYKGRQLTVEQWLRDFEKLFANEAKDYWMQVNWNKVNEFLLNEEIDIVKDNLLDIQNKILDALGKQHPDVKRHYVYKQAGVLFELKLENANKNWQTTKNSTDYHYHIDYIDTDKKLLIQAKYTKDLTVEKEHINRMKLFRKRKKNFKDYKIIVIWKEKNWKDEPMNVYSEERWA